MFTIDQFVQPATLAEAYELLVSSKTNRILGGCAFLRMTSLRIATAIDLSQLGLNEVNEHDDRIEIGAMTTFRQIETHPLLKQYYCGLLPKAVGNIMGVQFRNIVTVGASVYSKYGFSDLITALLALDTKVELYHNGRMTLAQFLNTPVQKDILTKIIIKKDERLASYEQLRNSASDYPILTVAVSSFEDKSWIVVGARPSCATIAHQASLELSKGIATDDDISRIADLASNECSFGSNMRGSAKYRKAMACELVKRAIKEVYHAN
ncbi:CO/xanthine dehydrogenase FAD-binding subunit [Sporomusaceae bacterium BoRhaA]|uniref:FAD binding domain-containing protein n=1 Tax=Pelorhabdus rhamnosifermentans TaxID=2772457 RepID=UPI001C05F960|nr:FAD binding domain-containing protein [Pelorhabdus rhamnosifermentans]MBU2701874.1 CO/xanthine dehydrogenase FAD-binding subunit [Pelorhabdus rhamnosifermentans]